MTSHVSIMARGMGIPALVGVEGIMDAVRPGDFDIMDASRGVIIINPEPEVLKNIKRKQTSLIDARRNWKNPALFPPLRQTAESWRYAETWEAWKT